MNALKSVEGAELAGCAARSAASADGFAALHGVASAHGCYADLANDPSVDVVYVSTIHHLHHEHALLCLVTHHPSPVRHS